MPHVKLHYNKHDKNNIQLSTSTRLCILWSKNHLFVISENTYDWFYNDPDLQECNYCMHFKQKHNNVYCSEKLMSAVIIYTHYVVETFCQPKLFSQLWMYIYKEIHGWILNDLAISIAWKTKALLWVKGLCAYAIKIKTITADDVY